MGIDLEHLAGAEIEHQQIGGGRIECQAQQMRTGACDHHLSDYPARVIEDDQLAGAVVAPEGGNPNVVT